MLRPKLVIDPPKSVPGPFVPPSQPPMLPTVHAKSTARYYVARGTESLAGLAELYYNNPREATRIFNANRIGMLRSDHAMGMLRSPQDPLPAGAVLLIP